MTRAEDYLLEELAMLKEMVAAKEAELAALAATRVVSAVATPDAADERPAKRRKLTRDTSKQPAKVRSYVYRFGVRVPKKVPKAKTYGVVTTLRETTYDHVSIKDGKLYLMVADEANPATDLRVNHVLRSSKAPTGGSRRFSMYDLWHKGVRVGTVRSKADLLRRMGVDVPTVYSCCKAD